MIHCIVNLFISKALPGQLSNYETFINIVSSELVSSNEALIYMTSSELVCFIETLNNSK